MSNLISTNGNYLITDKKIIFKNFESSNILSPLIYSVKTKTLNVRFKSNLTKEYIYENVDKTEFNSILSIYSGSVGKYISKIKKNCKFTINVS